MEDSGNKILREFIKDFSGVRSGEDMKRIREKWNGTLNLYSTLLNNDSTLNLFGIHSFMEMNHDLLVLSSTPPGSLRWELWVDPENKVA